MYPCCTVLPVYGTPLCRVTVSGVSKVVTIIHCMEVNLIFSFFVPPPPPQLEGWVAHSGSGYKDLVGEGVFQLLFSLSLSFSFFEPREE